MFACVRVFACVSVYVYVCVCVCVHMRVCVSLPVKKGDRKHANMHVYFIWTHLKLHSEEQAQENSE